MNNPMKMMYAEHEIIQQAEKVIDALNAEWETDAIQYEANVNKLLTFFREYADGFHHRKEEEVLFPAILSHPDFVIPEMIDALTMHHDEFREYARDIQLALEKTDFAESYKLLKHYMRDLQDHISAENDELFVLAEHLFSLEEKENVFFRFKDIDMQLGEADKKALEQMIASM